MIDGALLCAKCGLSNNPQRTYTIEGWAALQRHIASEHPVSEPPDARPEENK